jgi:ferric-dicitrate binding protein FerR (iron transport regulator)
MSEIGNKRTEDAELQQLLRTVGSRATPPADLALQVRDAVHEEWRTVVSQRNHRRVRTLAAAASVVAAVALVASVAVLKSTPTAQMAVVTRVDGLVTRDAGLLQAEQKLASGATIYVGDEVSTTHASRTAIRIDEGVAFRLDAQSSVRLLAADRLELTRGAVYVDADPSAQIAASFAVETTQGTVRHIGTQYEVRTTGHAIEVSVREGRVAIDRNGVLHSGAAGERIAIQGNGTLERSRLARADSAWQWVYQIAPGFDIENQSLARFLSWYARETGHVITFADSQVQKSAEQMMLRGSIEGLDPEAALDAVLATTNLMVQEQDDGTLTLVQR